MTVTILARKLNELSKSRATRNGTDNLGALLFRQVFAPLPAKHDNEPRTARGLKMRTCVRSAALDGAPVSRRSLAHGRR